MVEVTGARLWWREASGAVADLGVLIPISLALIVVNGLSATAVIVPAGLAYIMVAVVYRVPVAVQPLKAFGAIAIAIGAGPNVIAAGAILMGATFVVLGAFGLLTRLARVIPLGIVRGVQASVGLTLCLIAYRLLAHPPASFVSPLAPRLAFPIALALLAVLLIVRRSAALVMVILALVVAVVIVVSGDHAGGIDGAGIDAATWGLGPTPVHFPHLDAAAFALAATALVLPQIPVTLANSCVAPADAAARYFGAAGRRVKPDRLALTLGLTNLGVGAVSGMPVCHGAGGMSAHYFFGARTWRAPALIGGALVVVGLTAARPLAAVLPSFPLPVLAAMLAAAGVAHIKLVSDLRGWSPWVVAAVVGLAGATGHLVEGIVVGVLIHVAVRLAARLRAMSSALRPPTMGATTLVSADSAVSAK